MMCESNAQEKSLSNRRAFAYSVLAIPITAVGVPLSVYLPPFYAAEIGLSLSAVGLIFMLARFWDVFTDPFLGFFVDRYHSRWGMRKHWIALGTPILMLSSYYIFMPGAGVGQGYLLGWLFVLYFGFTLIDVSHKAWAPDLAEDYDDRTRLFGWRESVNLFGSISILVLPVLIDFFSNSTMSDENKASAMGWFLILTLPISVFIVFKYVPDKISKSKNSDISISDVLMAVKNKLLIRLLVSEFFAALCVSSSAAMYLFVAKWVFELERYGSLSIVVYFLGGVVAVPFWLKLSKAKGKHVALSISCVYYAVVLIGYLFLDPKGSLVSLLVFSILCGFSFTAPQILIRSMIADVVDYEESKSDKNYAGLYYSLMSTVYKVGGAFSVGVTYLTLDFIGFSASGENSSEEIYGLFLTFVFMPMIFSLCCAAVSYGYPLSRDVQKRSKASI